MNRTNALAGLMALYLASLGRRATARGVVRGGGTDDDAGTSVDFVDPGGVAVGVVVDRDVGDPERTKDGFPAFQEGCKFGPGL